MNNDLLLLSGNDIPFTEAQLTIHQPIIKEIAYIGEETFFMGCEFLNFSKDNLSEEDKVNLGNKTNFEILMSIMKSKKVVAQQNKNCALLVLMLLFPEYSLSLDMFMERIVLRKDGEEHFINNKNYEAFKDILISIFCLDRNRDDVFSYNPGNATAKKIAEKLKKGREKAASLKGESQKISILERYVSILSVGENKDINSLMQYTVYQLFDEFQRFELKQSYDIYFKAKLAGAKDLDEVENWMKSTHS